MSFDPLKLYNEGLQGVKYEPEHFHAFMASLKHPLFGDAARGLEGSGRDKLSMPYALVKKALGSLGIEPFTERQTCSDCVSHGTRNAVDITRACEILMSNENESFVTIGATEAIYGARGYSGDGGMSCSRAAQFVSETGGVLLRKKYGDIDLTKYSGSTAIRFGRGIPKELVGEGKKHQVKTVSLITTLEQLRDALANGYGVACCSGQGFSSTRDKDGFCRAQGSWAHCMCIGGFDDKSARKGVLIINSWGAYLSGPSPEWGTLPVGGFMAELDVVQRMLNGRGTFAFSNVDGFPTQNITSLGFDSYL